MGQSLPTISKMHSKGKKIVQKKGEIGDNLWGAVLTKMLSVPKECSKSGTQFEKSQVLAGQPATLILPVVGFMLHSMRPSVLNLVLGTRAIAQQI